MFGIHLVSVSERMVRGMDDDLRMIMRVWSAMGTQQASGTVTFRRPVAFGTGCRVRDCSVPGLIAEYRTVLADKDRRRQSVLEQIPLARRCSRCFEQVGTGHRQCGCKTTALAGELEKS